MSEHTDDAATTYAERSLVSGSARESRWPGWEVLLGPVLTLVLGVWGVTSTPLWLDEMATAEAIQEGLSAHSWEPQSLPGYAVFLAWTRLIGQQGDLALRLLPLAASVAAVLLTALTASRLAGRRAGASAGLLMAVLPSVMRYAQEARI